MSESDARGVQRDSERIAGRTVRPTRPEDGRALPSVEKPMAPGAPGTPVVTNPQSQELKQEEMARLSPDGRAPEPGAAKRSWTALYLVLAGCAIFGIALILPIFIEGVPAVLLGFVYVLAFLVAASPVWGSMLMRQSEEEQAEGQVRVIRRWRNRVRRDHKPQPPPHDRHVA